MLRRDWRRIAEGCTADIFGLDERRVLKLFKQGYSMDAARREYENHRMVSGIMAQVPRVFACAAYEGRVGLTMENVRGPSLASRMLDARTFEQAMDLFAQLHMSWLSHTARRRPRIRSGCIRVEMYRACMRRTHGDIETYISPLREFWPYEVMWEQ